jgi:hypothetical protein
MPYINRADYKRASHSPETPGELNFAITTLLVEYTMRKGLFYSTINDVMGAVEGAKAEYYRRVAAPYEDTKREKNGDVYPDDILIHDFH